jgi:4-hydroxy-tetrahydrodipicolinate reductase
MANTNIIICGIGGKMGKMLVETAKDFKDIKIVAGVDRYCAEKYNFPVFEDFSECNVSCDVVIDFSRPEALESIINYCAKNRTPVILACTGYQDSHRKQIEKASAEFAVFHSSNMSLGINLLSELVKKAAEALEGFDIEIIEKHHNKKADSPSGTALTLANSINSVFKEKKNYIYGRHSLNAPRKSDEIGIHAVRGGTLAGEHDVLFMGNNEVITLSHSAQTRVVFAEGALKAALYMKGKQKGLFSMSDMIKNR